MQFYKALCENSVLAEKILVFLQGKISPKTKILPFH